MLNILHTNRYLKDNHLMAKRGIDLPDLTIISNLLRGEKPLPRKYLDHKLLGYYVGHRECHVKNDILLIYKKTETHIYFVRLGTHSDIFG